MLEMLPDVLWKFLIGAALGGLSRYALPGRNPGGLIVAVMVGLAGSFLAAFLGNHFGWYREGDVNGIAACVVGAIVLLAIFRFISGTTAKAGADKNYDL